MKRGYTPQQVIIAKNMLADGFTYGAIARHFGKRSPDGIRRILDDKYRLRRNEYMARWMAVNDKRNYRDGKWS